MWKALPIAGFSLALSMSSAFAQAASPAPQSHSARPPELQSNPRYPGAISCLLCTTCGSYWPYIAGYFYTANVNYGGTYTRSNSCAAPWAWRTGYTRLCCSTDY